MQPEDTPSWAFDPRRQPWAVATAPAPPSPAEPNPAARLAGPGKEPQVESTPEREDRSGRAEPVRPEQPSDGAVLVNAPWQVDLPAAMAALPRLHLPPHLMAVSANGSAPQVALRSLPTPPPVATRLPGPEPVSEPLPEPPVSLPEQAPAAIRSPEPLAVAMPLPEPPPPIDVAGLPAGLGSPAPHQPDTAPPRPVAGLTFDSIVTHRTSRPTQGWRAAAFTATGGMWNPGPSRAERAHLERLARIRTPLPGRHLVTVMSLKGGIGKTTSAALLGLVLAEFRGDHVIAMDANPDAGTLAERLLGQQPLTNVQHLLANAPAIEHASDLARITELAGRLQVLASDQNPLLSQTFDETRYRQVLGVLKKFCNVIITDTGTGVVDSVVQGALAETHSLIVTGAPTGDGAVLASRTLDWLANNGHGRLVERAIVVLSCDRVSRDINRRDLRSHFEGRARAVVEIPRDPHLAKGQRIHLDELRPATRAAAMELAALVAEQFRTVNDADPIVREH